MWRKLFTGELNVLGGIFWGFPYLQVGEQSWLFGVTGLTWRRGVSARDKEVGADWDTLAKSSSTSSWCNVSGELTVSSRVITMALVLSARNIRWRHRSRAWLTSCRALDRPQEACGEKVRYHTNKSWSKQQLQIKSFTVSSSLFWHMEMASWGGTIFHSPSLPRMM